MSDYAMEVEIPVRYRDIDTVHHVNNAVYVTYLEQARVEYIDEVLETSAVEPQFVIANITVDYKRPILLGQEVVVALSVTDIGTASITMEYEIRADGAVAATASSVMVTVSSEEKTSKPVPDEWRKNMSAYEGREF